MAVWIQSRTWPQAEDSGFGGSLTEADQKLNKEVLDEVRKLLGAWSAAKKKTLVHLGIGAGNPGDGWGNPSHDYRPEVLERQKWPPFLDDAVEQGYSVISLVHNVIGQNWAQVTKGEGAVQLEVNARFPLKGSAGGVLDKQVWTEIETVVKQADRVVVANCVTNQHHRGVVELAQSRNRAHCYLLSYAQTGTEEVWWRMSAKFVFHNQETDLSTLGELFYDLQA
ncbi:hypothetical protein SAMN04487905_12213 [Actinopolyspora xinjiangensis]|uniref:Uncharacterized protein n=1 Tax=Actinopolyspora xinjiangensis TaxID=405564 RepID=A0A1H0X1R1_9ACTN|nr:hypothetical protein [Actinopolyspora xinjiangensis]SDP96883.1 hypothetical protein SAMN04487905_12213 [Actinopolyspora xinjiangensis]